MELTAKQLNELRSSPVTETGNRLGRAIKISGVSLSAIHDETELSVSYISDTARGRYRTITVDNASKLAGFFGCAIEDLFPSRQAVAS